MEGIQNIKTIEEDVKIGQSLVLGSRTQTKIIKEQIANAIMKLFKLKRRQERLKKIKQIATTMSQICIQKYGSICENNKKGNFGKSYEIWEQLKQQMSGQDHNEINSVFAISQLLPKLQVFKIP